MSRSKWPLVVALIFYANVTHAFWYEGPKKFTFLPLQSFARFDDLSANTCNVTLASFNQAWDLPSPVPKIKAACAAHQDCILNNLDEGSKAYMATASLVLGFAPVLLSTAGPTLSEIGLLSLERPILAVLISLGTAAVYPSRVLGHEDDSCRRLLKRRYRIGSSIVRFISEPRYKYLVSALEYVLVIAAVINIILASWQLGVGSVVTFRCTISLLPLVWVLAPAMIHLFTSAAFILHRRRQRGPRAKKSLKHLLLVEARPCIAHDPLPTGTIQHNTLVMVFHGFSALLGFVHVMFGVLIFSSLLFTMIIDAAAIISRYFASVLLCRAILIIELEGLRYVHQQSTSKPLLCRTGTFVSLGDAENPRVFSDTERRSLRTDSQRTLIGVATSCPGQMQGSSKASILRMIDGEDNLQHSHSKLDSRLHLGRDRSPNPSLYGRKPSEIGPISESVRLQLTPHDRTHPREHSSRDFVPYSFGAASGPEPAFLRGRTGLDARSILGTDDGVSSCAQSPFGGSVSSSRNTSRSPNRAVDPHT